MKILIDRNDCIECGVCMGECPHVFELMPPEKARVVQQFRNGAPERGNVGPDLSASVKRAADACPVQVIEVL